MKQEDYKKLERMQAYEPLWFELLNASGFAGNLPDGRIVDRRYYPEAYAIKKNSLFGIAEPKEIQKEKCQKCKEKDDLIKHLSSCIEEQKGLIEKLSKLRDECRHYLMSVESSKLTVEDALESLGFGRNGLET